MQPTLRLFLLTSALIQNVFAVFQPIKDLENGIHIRRIIRPLSEGDQEHLRSLKEFFVQTYYDGIAYTFPILRPEGTESDIKERIGNMFDESIKNLNNKSPGEFFHTK